MLKYLIFITLIFTDLKLGTDQSLWDCTFVWKPAPDSDKTNITTTSINPASNGVKGRYPSKANFTVDFYDVDWGTKSSGKTCKSSWFSIPNASYTVEFSIEQVGNFASFNSPL
jgi:hypothetical protein